MENWKTEELARFDADFRVADEVVRGPYRVMTHAATQVLFPSKHYIESNFECKRRLLRQEARSISIPDVEDGEVLRDLAIAWAEVSLHADTSGDDWFEASTDYVFQLGKFSHSRRGLGAFLWDFELGKQLSIWQQEWLSRFYAEKGQELERILLQRIDHGSHPTLGILLSISNTLDGLVGFIQSENEQKRWIYSGSDFFGRLLFTHAFCVGMVRLEDSVGLWRRLSVVNGAIAAWPYPLVRDREFTFVLFEKMGVPHHLPRVEPGYFESEAWRQRLLKAARDYLDNFQRLFCEGVARESVNSDAWKQLGSSLQTFNELVLVYDIDHYRES